MKDRTATVLVAHPSPDLYGSDLQLVESVLGLVAGGFRVIVVLPCEGPLIKLLTQAGAEVSIQRYPVLRKAIFTPAGLLTALSELLFCLWPLFRLVRSERPVVIYVNTLTIPIWTFIGRLSGVPSILHLHEAVIGGPVLIRRLLSIPAMVNVKIISNSKASTDALCEFMPGLASKVELIYNGVPAPPTVSPLLPRSGKRVRIVFVGRLSPRKGTDLALTAVHELRKAGHDVELAICGSVYPGYEWYERSLRRQALDPNLRDVTEFLGYVNPTWDVLASADIVVVPSREEPFGNTAVEAMLSMRPLVASGVQGLLEIVEHRRNGLLFTSDDVASLIEELKVLLEDEGLAMEIAQTAFTSASSRFSNHRYRLDVLSAVRKVIMQK